MAERLPQTGGRGKSEKRKFLAPPGGRPDTRYDGTATCVRVLWDLTKEGRCSGVFDLNDDSSPTILAAHVAALRACGAEEDEDDANY